jgi:hypothetical protein
LICTRISLNMLSGMAQIPLEKFKNSSIRRMHFKAYCIGIVW